MDYEIQYNMTIDYVERTFKENQDILDIYHVCVPFRVTTCTSMYEDYWRPWDEDKKAVWVRQKPERAMTFMSSLSTLPTCGIMIFKWNLPNGYIKIKRLPEHAV
mgnify:CR=1 FL=1